MWFTTIVLMAYAVLIIYTTMQKMPGTGMFVELMAAFFEGHLPIAVKGTAGIDADSQRGNLGIFP